MKVLKRDGRKVEFNQLNIESAIKKAFYRVDKVNDTGDIIANKIAEHISELNKDLTVEEIQDMVEKKLMSSNRKDVAKAYILYRNERNIERERNSDMMKSITEKLSANNIKNQNANVDEKSFGGRMGEANSELMKKFALDYIISDMAKSNHINNEVYIHDLDHYAVGDHNCLSIPFDKLLANGFNTRQTDVRPAQSISTAFQLVAVIFQLQSLQQFGGVSATHLDWTMMPYVRKSFYKHFIDGLNYLDNMPKSNNDILLKTLRDNMPSITDESYFVKSKTYEYAMDMTNREIRQAVEGMYHNLNTLQSRSGNQLNTRWLAA